MNKKKPVTIGSIAAIILLACACPVSGLPSLNGNGDATPELPFPPTMENVPATEVAPPTEVVPTEAATIPVAPVGEVIFSDDFSAPSAEMETYEGNEGSAGTENGIYFVRSNADLWQWGKSNSEYPDVVVDVDVTMTQGPANHNAGFGVVCRLSEREDTSVDGYMLAISGDGYYTIRAIAASNMSPLVDWTSSSVINEGNATNHIRATCNGGDLSLAVNGEVLATASASSDGSTTGAIAFAAISFESDSPLAEAQFDNLIVSKP